MRLLAILAIITGCCSATRRRSYDVSIVQHLYSIYSAIDGRLLLMDPLAGHYPISPNHLDVVLPPELRETLPIAWSADHGIELRLEPVTAFGGGLSTPGVAISRNHAVGPFTLVATLGPPVDKQITIPGFAYESMTIGCASGFSGGYRIDAHGIPQETSRAEDADIYIVSPVSNFVWDKCSADFVRRDATSTTLFVPGGAINNAAEPADFPKVDASFWRGPTMHVLDSSLVVGTLLWRTRDGRLMKTLQHEGGDDSVIGQTLMADENGRFADNGWLPTVKTATTAVSDSDLTALNYTAVIYDLFAYSHTQYGALAPLELRRGSGYCYPGGNENMPAPQIACVRTNPQVYPQPLVTWSLFDDTGREVRKQQRANESNNVTVDAQSCALPLDLPVGWFTLVASVGSPVSLRITRRIAVYDTLALDMKIWNSAITFQDNRATHSADARTRDLYLTTDGVLHFPYGGTMLTNGVEQSWDVPANAHAAGPFATLSSALWRNDRKAINILELRAFTHPCNFKTGRGYQTESFCHVMSAAVLLFKAHQGRYVKLYVADDLALGAAFEISDDRGQFSVFGGH